MYLLKCKELFNKTALDSESYFIKKVSRIQDQHLTCL